MSKSTRSDICLISVSEEFLNFDGLPMCGLSQSPVLCRRSRSGKHWETKIHLTDKFENLIGDFVTEVMHPRGSVCVQIMLQRNSTDFVVDAVVWGVKFRKYCKHCHGTCILHFSLLTGRRPRLFYKEISTKFSTCHQRFGPNRILLYVLLMKLHCTPC